MSWLNRVLKRTRGEKQAPVNSDVVSKPAALDKAPIQARLHRAVLEGERDLVERLISACLGRPNALAILEQAITTARKTRWHAVLRDLEKAKDVVALRHASLAADDSMLADVPTRNGRKYLDPCELLEPIGRGAMGVVYRAHHCNLGIDVAVKCLRPAGGQLGPDAVQQLWREARAAASIQCPNVVRVFDALSRFGVHYIIMEYVRGETARDRVIRHGSLTVEEALFIATEAARGLAVAHRAGIVHRDVKPDNILISVTDEVKVSDLGLANPDLGTLLADARAAIDGGQSLLLTEALVGTPLYMAPEQWIRPGEVRFTADVWAMGAVLYFLLTGDDPTWAGKPCGLPGATFPKIAQVRDVPAPVARVIEKATAVDPSRRYTSASDLVAELDGMVVGVKLNLRRSQRT